MGTVLLICGYLYIAIAVIFGITILRRIIKKEGFTARDKALPVIIVGIGFLYIIALAFHYSEEIGLSDRIQILLMFGLVAVTTFYAWSASRQADASVKMAEEMKEQRYAALRPIIDIVEMQMEPMELAKQAYGVREGNFPQGLPCILRNIGVGPALNVYSPIEDAGGEPRQWNFGVIPIAIGEEEMGCTHEMRLFLEQRDDHRALIAYYEDVYGNLFESSREVSVSKEKDRLEIGPLKVRKLSKEEPTK